MDIAPRPRSRPPLRPPIPILGIIATFLVLGCQAPGAGIGDGSALAGGALTGCGLPGGPPAPTTSEDPAPMTLDAQAIGDHLARPEGLCWVKGATLLVGRSRSCVDGRERSPVVGTPGGDAGALVVALAALERIEGRQLSEEEIDGLFDAYLRAFGRFYMHSDRHALDGLATEPHLTDAVHEHGGEGLFRSPPPALAARVLDALVRPEHVGCGHLRLLLTHPDAYQVRRELVEGVIRRTLTEAWRGGPVDLVVLEGEHREGAVLEVQLDREIHPFTFIPMVAPRLGDHELFVDHPEVNAWLRRESAAFLFEEDPVLHDHPEQRQALLDEVERLGRRHLERTVAQLAADLPVFVAHVLDDTGHVRVSAP